MLCYVNWKIKGTPQTSGFFLKKFRLKNGKCTSNISAKREWKNSKFHSVSCCIFFFFFFFVLIHLYTHFLNRTQCLSATGNLYSQSDFTQLRSENAHPTSLQTEAWTLVLPCGFCCWCIKILIDLVLWSPVITWCSAGEIAAFYLWSEFVLAGFPAPPSSLSCRQWRTVQ